MKVKDIIGGQAIFRTNVMDPDIFRIGNDFQFDLGLKHDRNQA